MIEGNNILPVAVSVMVLIWGATDSRTFTAPTMMVICPVCATPSTFSTMTIIPRGRKRRRR